MAAGDYRKPRPGRQASNRAKRLNKKDVNKGSRFNQREHHKNKRPPGAGQNDPGKYRGRP